MGNTLGVCVSDPEEEKNSSSHISSSTSKPAASSQSASKGNKKFKVMGQNGATIRSEVTLDSPVVATLPKDSIIDVGEVVGRRAHLVGPVVGWASITTETGYVILSEQP